MKKQATTPLEKDVQREICDWLHEKGYFFWRQNNVPIFGMSNDGTKRFRSMPKYTPKGIPDIFVVSQGKLWGFEVKRSGAVIRPAQLEFGDSMLKNGAKWYVVYTLKDVVDLLTFIPADMPLPPTL